MLSDIARYVFKKIVSDIIDIGIWLVDWGVGMNIKYKLYINEEMEDE